MAINAEKTFSLDLSLFGGKVSDIAAGNTPAGTSPFCLDMFFGAQYVATRPALIHSLNAALASGADVLSHLDFPQSTGQTNCIILYENCTLWSNNVQSGTSVQLGTATPGCRFKAVAAFNHFFMAFRSLSLTTPFTSAQAAGGDIPRYVNALGHTWRVTSDAPGGGYSVSGVNIGPTNIINTPTYVGGPDITSITYSDPITVSLGKFGSETVYTTATVLLSSSVSLTAGFSVQIYGVTWSLPNGPQWANGVAIQSVISGDTFKIPIQHTTVNNVGSGGTFAYATSIPLTRDNNIVTAFLAGTSVGSPTKIQAGWYVTPSDTQATSNAAVPNSGEVPFTPNELFQAIYPSSATGGTAAQLIEGAVITFYTYPHANNGAFNFDYPGDGYNEVLPAAIATATFPKDITMMMNPNGTPDGDFLPGAPSGAPNPWPFYGVNSSGNWDGNTFVPYAGAGTDSIAVISGYMSFPVAGNYTFRILNDDGLQIGFASGITLVSSSSNNGGPANPFNPQPHTVSALNGYPLLFAMNASTEYGGVDIYDNNITINVAAPGTYGVEWNYVNWEGGGRLIMANVIGGVDYPIQPTIGPGIAKVQGDGVGNIHVTLPTAVEAMPIGSWYYLFLEPPVASNIIDWLISSNGTALITVQNSTLTVGQSIELNGFTSVSNPEPTGWNGQTVVITAATINSNGTGSYQFSWNGPTGSGTTTTGTATPSTQSYPSGWVQVTQVISTTEFVYYAVDNTATSVSDATVYDYFGSLNTQQSLTPTPGQTNTTVPPTASGSAVSTQSSASGIVQGFQVLSVDTSTTPNSITWYQAGFNDTYTGTHTLQVQPNTQIAGGPRNMFVFFINEDDGATPGGYPIYVQLNGGTQFAEVTLPIGPPGTVARGVAWTPAYGALYFVTGAGQVPASAGNGPVLSLGTIINDNTTTKIIQDFSDAALEDGILVGPGIDAVGEDYGDLTSTIVLPPCLGVIEYNQQLVWWGELNNYPNHQLNNMGMQGGSPTVSLTGVQPPGWNSTTSYNGFVPDGNGTLAVAPDNFGWTYNMSSGSSHTQTCMLSQPAYQDYYGAPVFLPNRNYYQRFNGAVVSGSPTGNLIFEMYSPTAGLLAKATIACNLFTSAMSWLGNAFNASMPNSIPSDTVFFFTLDGTATTNFTIAIRDLQEIDAQQPVLNNQLRTSYIDNEFGYDNENGYIVGIDTPAFITGCFLQRAFLYAITDQDGDLAVIQANGQTPSQWSATMFAKECSCSGPDAVCTGQSIAWWMGRHGVHIFEGQQPRKISQPVAQDFEQTNWNAAVNSCMAYDSIQRQLYMSFPTGVSINPSFTQTMNSRLADTAYNVPDPVHVSSYTGKVISTDLCQKWCEMSIPINSMQMSTRSTPLGFAKVMTFGGGAVGPVSFDASASNTGTGSTQTLSITPASPTDLLIYVTNAEGVPTTPAGMTETQVGTFTQSLTSDATIDVSCPNIGIGVDFWANVACTLATTTTPNIVFTGSFGGGSIGTGPHTVNLPSVVAGQAIIVTVSQVGPGVTAGQITVSDDKGNTYFSVLASNNNGSYTVGAAIFVALGVKGGSTNVTMTLPAPLGNVIAATAFQYSGISGPQGFGQLYIQDFANYPPVTPTATTWNCVDADYGNILWAYQTYFFFAHDTEQQPMLALYQKLFCYLSFHAVGLGETIITPYVDALNNPWEPLPTFTLQLADAGADHNIGLEVHGNRCSFLYQGVAASAMLLTHMVVSARKDLVFPVTGLSNF